MTDSKPGILNAAFYALETMNVLIPSMEILNELIGIPLQDYFREICGFDEENVAKAVLHFRKYYGEKGVYENEVYNGIPELLKKLKDDGRNIYISTAKYEKYALVVSEFFNFAPFITDLIGADAGGKHATKSGLAAAIILRNSISDKNATVVIGDKYMDVNAGHDNGIDSIAVSYGFGSEKELRDANPTYLVNSVRELSDILLLY